MTVSPDGSWLYSSELCITYYAWSRHGHKVCSITEAPPTHRHRVLLPFLLVQREKSIFPLAVFLSRFLQDEVCRGEVGALLGLYTFRHRPIPLFKDLDERIIWVSYFT